MFFFVIYCLLETINVDVYIKVNNNIIGRRNILEFLVIYNNNKWHYNNNKLHWHENNK